MRPPTSSSVRAKALSKPPKKRMLNSNTDTLCLDCWKERYIIQTTCLQNNRRASTRLQTSVLVTLCHRHITVHTSTITSAHKHMHVLYPNTHVLSKHTCWHTTHTHTHIRTHAHLIKIQLVCHPFSCCLKLLHHLHDVQSVQRVHNSGTNVSEPKYGRRAPTFSQWIQLVITPSISDIVSPCMNHHLSSVCVGGGGGGGMK